jgi:hypothetical protein
MKKLLTLLFAVALTGSLFAQAAPAKADKAAAEAPKAAEEKPAPKKEAAAEGEKADKAK